LLEEVYNLEDALVVAGFLNSFIRHADVLKIANIAQIVNVIAPILTRGDEILLQSIFYPLEMYARRREGISLQPVLSGPSYEGKTNGEVTLIDTSAILNGDTLNVFATNRSVDQPSELVIDLSDRPISNLTNGDLLTGPSAKSANSYEHPDLVRTVPISGVTIEDGKARVTLPPLSVAAMTFGL
jgi:alpha-N-arabinofuranosidase